MRVFSFGRPDRALRIGAKWFLALAGSSLVAGCATSARTVYDNPTLNPGDTVNCVSDPCNVYFQMPGGSGSHVVRENNFKTGEYPVGERYYAGSYWQGITVFTVEGMNVPPAYLNVMANE